MRNEKLKDTYNKIAEEWHQDHQTDDWWQEGTDKFISYLPAGASILDVGCGGGTKSKYLASKGLHVLGIDFSENMITIATRAVPNATFFVKDIYDIESLDESLDESFDGIFMQAVVLHIPKQEVDEVLRQAVTKQNPSGYLYIAVKEKVEGGADEEVKIEDDYGYRYERFFSYFSIDELRQHLQKVGLVVVYEDVKPPSRTARKSNWLQIIGRKIS